jgi:hypothetical protein
MPFTVRRLARSLATAMAASLIATAGQAAAATPAAVTCIDAPSSKVFLPWLDVFDYQRVPGGNFESGLAGWSTSGGAQVVTDNEPWKVGGAADSHALSLPKGASATSPPFCAGLGYPTVRLFSTGGGLPVLTSLKVELIYTDPNKLLRSFGLVPVLPSAAWQPSLPLLTLSGLPLLTGSSMAVRITAVGAAFRVDDVYVDPYQRH